MTDIGHEQEFYISLIIYGGLLMAGILVVSVLLLFGFAIRRKIKDSNVTKKLYEQERKNGTGGSQGNY